ncbi:g9006 [Coccomyxa elongata]
MAGLLLEKTSHVEQFLRDVVSDSTLPEDVRILADSMLEESDRVSYISWKLLKEVAMAVKERWGDARKPWLHRICAGSSLVLKPPKPRVKSAALQARLALLQRQLEQKQYDAMVHDITTAEREAEAKSEGCIVTYKAQLSVGLHIVVMMGTFFAAGYLGVSYLSTDPMHHVVGGLVGMICAMLMETVLLIIRTTVPPTLPVEELLRQKRQPRSMPDLTSEKKVQ